MSRENKAELINIIAGVALFALALFAVKYFKLSGWAELLVFLVPYVFIGRESLVEAGYGIIHGQVFDENFLMSIATIGALCIGEYHEAVFVMLFYKAGELFEHIAVGKSRRSIEGLMSIMPEYANLETENGVQEVDPYEVEVGCVIVVKAGERVPLDGIVIEGSSSLNTAALTGEPLPRDVSVGDKVISGCINEHGVLRIRTTCGYEDSTVARILDLVENSAAAKAKTESFITRFARVYTPAVVIGALLLAVIPPLFVGNWWDWVYRALTFLVISCPCALVISIPLTFFASIGKASRRGILVKGSNYLEALSKVHTVVFDKTGTLTKGSFTVTGVHPVNMGETELMACAAAAEKYSDHPIAQSIKAAYDGEIPDSSDWQEQAGMGITVKVGDKQVCVGNCRLMSSLGIECEEGKENRVHVGVDGKYAGYIDIEDEIKAETPSAIASLKKQGVEKTAMLTGDRQAEGEAVGNRAGIDAVFGDLLPEDKVTKLEELLRALPKGKKLVYVGDGINDAPVLTRADVGIAMGGLGSDAAIEAADVVIMDDNLERLPEAVTIARYTNRIVTQNIAFILIVKAAILLLGALGYAGMWAAVFADVGTMVIAVLNAMRMLK